MGCGSSSAADPREAGGNGEFDDGNVGPSKQVNRPEDGGALFEVEDAAGQEFMAVKPWIGQVTEPDNHAEWNKEKPDGSYALEYVYGYKCSDSRQNVYYNN